MALSINDALRLAKEDPVFAKQLLKDPDSLKTAFMLTDAQIASIKAASLPSVLDMIPDPGAAAAPGGPMGGGIY